MRIIWIGPYPAPIKWINTWKEKHPDWEFIIFTDKMLKARTWHNQHLINEYYERQKWAGVQDLIRYELLYSEGGFIPPADAECFHNTEELFISPADHCYAVYENEEINPGYISPIYACNPKNEFVKMLIDELHKLKPEDLKTPFRSTGNEWLSKMIKKMPNKITIFPSHYFIPVHFSPLAKPYSGNDKIYANQNWGSTKSRLRNLKKGWSFKQRLIFLFNFKYYVLFVKKIARKILQ